MVNNMNNYHIKNRALKAAHGFLVACLIFALIGSYPLESDGAQFYDSSMSAVSSGNNLSTGSRTGDSASSGSMGSGPTIVSPSGLTSREQSALSRQYQFEVRNKGVMLAPIVSGSSGPSGDIQSGDYSNLEERLYHYFGAAISLYKEGRMEESSEILQYILDNDPENDYIKSYLERIRKEIKAQNLKQAVSDRRKAAFFKRNTINELVEDGINYYQNKEYDRALLKFADAVTMDPRNVKAKEYMEKLKTYYLKELRVENIVKNWEARKERENNETVPEDLGKPVIDTKILKAAEAILTEKNGHPSIESSGKDIDDEKMKKIILAKRAESLLEQAELEVRVAEIINVKKYEDKKSVEFTLGPGDVIQISVRDHPELSGLVPLRLKGEIVLPLVNDIVIGTGLTVDELSEQITTVLKRYVQEPYVNISIVEYRSKVFYIIDEVSCTAYPITRANLTLRDALFIADWGNNRALGRVIVIKPSKIHPIIKKVDAFDLIYRGNLESNIRIENGDVIYVPMTMAAKVTKTISDTLGPFRAIRAARDEYLNLKWNEQDWKSMSRMPSIYDNEAEDAKNLSAYGNFIDSIVNR